MAQRLLLPLAMSRLAKRVREARAKAGLTQVELAKRLGRSQTMVSLAENGVLRIGRRYVAAVLRACGVPARASERAVSPQPQQGYIVGIDPQTREVVWRGSKRDLELTEKYVWWANGHWQG